MNCFIVKPIFEPVASDNCLINENTTTTTTTTTTSLSVFNAFEFIQLYSEIDIRLLLLFDPR